MVKVNVEEAASQLRALLQRVAEGEEVILVEQDQEVARLVPPPGREEWLARCEAVSSLFASAGRTTQHYCH
jgi:antitoxin (DNA-binding transcriptional repressor) of toxin-antitoxin stability system